MKHITTALLPREEGILTTSAMTHAMGGHILSSWAAGIHNNFGHGSYHLNTL